MRTLASSSATGLLLLMLLPASLWGQEQPAPVPMPAPAVEGPKRLHEPVDLRLCWMLFGQATPQQRKAAVVHLAKRYPDFTADILGLLAKEHPNFYRTLDADMRKLVGTKYPAVGAVIEQQIGKIIQTKYPQVQQAVDSLIREKYSSLLVDLQSLP